LTLNKKLAVMAAILLLIVLPMLITNNYFRHIIIIIFLSIIFGQSWNLLGGYTGQVSFGHALFFAIGSYGTVLFITNQSLNELGGLFGHTLDPILALLFGAFCTIVITFILGLMIFRLRGPYLGLGTLALAQIGMVIAMNWKSLTNGGEGILLLDVPPIGPIELLGKLPFYYLSMTLMLFSVFFVYHIINSRMGYFLMAIREDDDASEAMGVPTRKYKILALILSAFLAALAGGFNALYVGFISPHDVFALHISIQMIFITIVGGVGTIMGPIVGAVLLTILSEVFQAYLGNAHLLVYGGLLVLVILYMPEGVYGFIKQKWERKRMVTAGAGITGGEPD